MVRDRGAATLPRLGAFRLFGRRMFNHSLAFDRPAYLALLGLIPLMWWLGYHSLSGLGRWRRWTALTLRSLVALGIILALADVQYRRRNDQLTVVYLLDQSLSIPQATRQAMLQYVASSVEHSADRKLDDKYAVIAFGRDATIEAPPVAATIPVPPRLESVLDPEYTDVATAVERAIALFPHDAAKRIVLVTDGNENRGNVFREAQAAAEAGVSIDVAPVYLTSRVETAVEKIDVPPGLRRGQPFNVRIVLSNDSQGAAARPIAGKLRLVRKAGPREDTVAEESVTIAPGKQTLTIRQTIDQADFYTYEAIFVPDDPEADGLAQNNSAQAFTHIRGKGAALLIENFETRGQFDELVERLRAEDIEVTVTATNELFGSLAELQRYDVVILANVSRSDAADGESGAAFSDEQVEMLVRNTRELGCGLIMLGGPDTFGAGGWANTKLEEAMPVDFQIKSAEVKAVGALAIVIDRSGSMDGEKLAMSKAAAIAAIRTLGRRDWISVTAFDSAAQHVVPLRRVDDYRTAARRVESIGSGGGTDMYPGMLMGFEDLRKSQAQAKHMIVLTDGQTPEAEFDRLVRQMRSAGITVSAVAVGSDANVPLLQQIATRGRGKFYSVLNPRNLPRIFLREVRARGAVARLRAANALDAAGRCRPRDSEWRRERRARDQGICAHVCETEPTGGSCAAQSTAAESSECHGAGHLDLWRREDGRVHHGFRPPVGGGVAAVGGLQQVLQPTRALGHAAHGRYGQLYACHQHARRPNASCGHGPQCRRGVPQQPGDDGGGDRAGHAHGRRPTRADRARALRGRVSL